MSDTLPLPTDLGDPLTSPIAQVLGMSIGAPWDLSAMAHAFRDNGVPLPYKAEAEYAYVLHWLLTLAIEHGEAWRAQAAKRVDELLPAHKAALARRRLMREQSRAGAQPGVAH